MYEPAPRDSIVLWQFCNKQAVAVFDALRGHVVVVQWATLFKPTLWFRLSAGSRDHLEVFCPELSLELKGRVTMGQKAV